MTQETLHDKKELMLGLPWWIWIVCGYVVSMGVDSLKDRWVKWWRLWMFPIIVLAIKIQNVHTWPWVMCSGAVLGGILGLLYAKTVRLQWSRHHPGCVGIPGGLLTFVVMVSFVLFKIAVGTLLARGLVDTALWKPVEVGVGAVFTGYNVTKVANWTWRSWAAFRV